MSEYSNLQKEAASLGLKAVGVTKEELKKMIANAEPKQESTEPEPEKTKSTVVKANIAIVRDGTKEVRRYTVNDHGEDFIDLAEVFAGKRKFTVELKYVDFENKCPNCGYQL